MNKKQPKICLTGATFETNNCGVSALTDGAIKSVMAAYPDAEITLLDYSKCPKIYHLSMFNREIEVSLLNIRFSKWILLSNNIFYLLTIALLYRFIPFMRVKKLLIMNNTVLNKIVSFDLVAAISGGDSFSDIYGLRRFLYMVFPQVLAILMGKRLILLPQTYGPYNRSIVRAIACYILKKADAVYSRDHHGLELINSLTGEGLNKVKFGYDVGFVLDITRPSDFKTQTILSQIKKEMTIVGLNVSGLLYMGGYTSDNMFCLVVDYPRLIHGIVDTIMAHEDTILLIIPHVFGDVKHKESDMGPCKRLYNTFSKRYQGRVFNVNGTFNQREIKYIIGLCDFFVGSRMHACIAALSQGIPAVGLAYSKKFAGVYQSIGLESLVADMRTLDENAILSIIVDSLHNVESIRKVLDEKIPEVRFTVLNYFKIT